MATTNRNPSLSSQNVSVRNRTGGSSRRTSSSPSSPTLSMDKQLKQRLIQQKEYRKSLILYKRPFRSLYLFLCVLYEYLTKLITQIISHPLIMTLIIPILVLIIIHFGIPQLKSESSEYIYYNIEWCGWWLILGILSSVGLGTGMHSGLLFLFPFIGQVCMVAATCHSLDFYTFGPSSFVCLAQNDASSSTVSFWGLFFKVFWPCFLWGAGTAIGEIPPYAVSLAAVRAGKQDEFAEVAEIKSSLESSKSQMNIFTKWKVWMIECLEKYGFWAVLAFAAWPNMAFDMAGIACGYFEMSFWTFFGATFIGKALIKINMQSIFFITMFNEHTLNKFIDWIEHFGFEWLAENATDFFEKQRKVILGETIPITNNNQSTPLFKLIWTFFVGCFILVFIGSTIQIFARQKQKEIDDKSNEQWKQSQ